MVKALLDKSLYQVGMEFELDRRYKNKQTMIASVAKIYNQVKNNPEKFAVSSDLLVEVDRKMKERINAIGGVSEGRTTIRERADQKKMMKIEDIALDNRAKASALLNIKLDDILSSNKARSKIGLMELAKVYGITFDKGQIVEGKATDHVALMGKLNTEMTPGAAIDAILKMRDYNQAVSEKATEKK